MPKRVSKVELQHTIFEPSQFVEVPYFQVAVVGRSNVGKSSLVNALLERKDLAHVSKMPGRTASINYYYLRLKEAPDQYTELSLVDLPGYGFARTGREEQRRWGALIEEYFRSRFAPDALLVLLDIRREPAEEEQWFFDLRKSLRQLKSLSVVLTKADKFSRNECRKTRATRAAELGVPAEQIFFSSRIDAELDEIERLRDFLGDLSVRCPR